MQDGVVEVLIQGPNPCLAMIDTQSMAIRSWVGVFRGCLLKEVRICLAALRDKAEFWGGGVPTTCFCYLFTFSYTSAEIFLTLNGITNMVNADGRM